MHFSHHTDWTAGSHQSVLCQLRQQNPTLHRRLPSTMSKLCPDCSALDTHSAPFTHTHTHRDISGTHMESHTCTELLLSSLRASDACWDSSFNYRLPTYGCQSLLLYISNIIVLLYIIWESSCLRLPPVSSLLSLSFPAPLPLPSIETNHLFFSLCHQSSLSPPQTSLDFYSDKGWLFFYCGGPRCLSR